MMSQFTRELPHHVTLQDLDYKFPKDAYPIGRLDADSEGLLLLSNNKALNQRILSPDQKWPKVYVMQVEGVPDDNELTPIREGFLLKIKKKQFKTLPAQIVKLAEPPVFPERNPPVRFRKSIPTSWLSMTLVEGKNRQVRKMMAAVGYPVLRLVRTRIGNIGLEDLFGNDLTPGAVCMVDEQKLGKS